MLLIKSFIAYSETGKKREMIQALDSIDECEVIASQNKEIVVFLLETTADEIEKEIIKKIKEIPSLHQISMVSGYQA